MWIVEVILGVVMFISNSFTLWLTNLFVAPFTNYSIFKILVPVYITLVVTQLFQEKKGTSRGNAMSNAAIALWGGIDFVIMTMKNGFDNSEIPKIVIASVIILYGLYIIVEGFLGSEIIKYVGRVREVSYFIIIFAPLYYTNATLSLEYIFGAVVFFYVYYRVVRLLDRIVPTPEVLITDIKEAAQVSLPDENQIKEKVVSKK